jgi:NADPH2:quinone reductase
MKAIQISKTGGPEVLTLAEIPTPKPKPNEVLLKISAAGVNFIDVYFREGRYPTALPFISGQEASGVVVEVGNDVKTFKPGDRAAYTGIMGSYAEYAVVPGDRAVRVPEGISDEQAAAAMLQGMTSHYLIHDTYPLKKGESALIHAAAGGVGLLLVQMAKNIGARVIATVGTEEKAKLALEAGADDIILYDAQDFEAETKRLLGGKGLDVIYDGVGKTTFDKDLNILRPRGYLVLFGGASGAVPPFDLVRLSQKGSLYITRPTLVNYIASHEELQTRAADVFRMIAAGKLKLRVGHKYPLGDAQQAHRDLEARTTTGKNLLIP